VVWRVKWRNRKPLKQLYNGGVNRAINVINKTVIELVLKMIFSSISKD